MIKPDPMIVETAERVCADLCSSALVNAAEDGIWPTALWDAMESTGLALAWVAEDAGGAGAGLADGFAVARASARHAAPVPVAETLCAGWLLAQSGVPVPAGPMTIAPVRVGERFRCRADGMLEGDATAIPFAAGAEHVVVIVADGNAARIALISTSECTVAGGRNLAGEPQGQVTLDGVRALEVADAGFADPWEALQRMGAALRSHQMAGALERILALSLEYARERVQFGRPIARFQAIQHSLASLAGETAAAGAAANAASSAIIRHGIDDARTLFAVAAAKIRAGEAAGAGAAIAHQVHGAMGFTREYSLHQSTRRLWAWRDDFGAEGAWAMRLGKIAADGGASELWPALTSL